MDEEAVVVRKGHERERLAIEAQEEEQLPLANGSATGSAQVPRVAAKVPLQRATVYQHTEARAACLPNALSHPVCGAGS